MSTDTLTIRSQLGDYPVHFHTNFGFLSRLASLPNPVILIDGNVLQLYKETLSAAFRDRAIYVLEATEDHKTLDETARIYQWIIDHFKAKRNIDFISIGGGITQPFQGMSHQPISRRWVGFRSDHAAGAGGQLHRRQDFSEFREPEKPFGHLLSAARDSHRLCFHAYARPPRPLQRLR